jgi:O-antigen/teichoic acid export membrane protein
LPSPRRAIRENPGLIRFLLATNGASTLNQAVTPIFVLYVGALLGPAAAGIYRLAQMVLKAAGTPGDLAMRSLFPELARLLTRDHGHFWRLIGRALALSTALGLLFAVVVAVLGPFFVTLTMGKDYAAAQPILQIIALCFVPNLAAFPLESALLALGHAGRVLVVRAIAAGAIFGTAGLLVAPLGLRGVGVAVALGAVIATAGLLLMLAAARRLHDNQHRAEPTASIMPSA